MTCEEEQQWEYVLEEALGAGGHSCLPDSYFTSKKGRRCSRDPDVSAPLLLPSNKHKLRLQTHSCVLWVPHCSEAKDTLFLMGRLISSDPVFV